MIKKNQKNLKEYDRPKSHKSSKPHVIYIVSNNFGDPVTKTFTTTAQQFGDNTNKYIHYYSFQCLEVAVKTALTGWTKITWKKIMVDVGALEIVRLLSNFEGLMKGSPPNSSGPLGCRWYQMDTAHFW